MSVSDRYAGPALSALRVVSALLFMEHGMAKLLHFPPVPRFTTAPQVGSLIWIAATLESVGGALLALGLFSRPVAFILSGEMAVAYWMAHAPLSLFPAVNGGDAAILFCFVFLYVAAAGPGAFSLDAVLRKDRSPDNRYARA